MVVKKPYSFRLAIPSDIKHICQLRQQALNRSCKTHYSTDVIEALSGSFSPYEYATAIAKREILLLVLDKHIHGYIWIQDDHGRELISDSPQGVPTAQGILLLLGIQRILNITSKDIPILATLNSISFYRRYGFKTLEPVEMRHRESGVPYTLQRMVLAKDKAEALLAKSKHRLPIILW